MYHLTKTSKRLIIPKIPQVCEGPEFYERRPRICLAPTIEQCLIGLAQTTARSYRYVDRFSPGVSPSGDERLRVMVPLGSPRFECPTPRQVPDVLESDEHWITEPWPFVMIGVIAWGWAARTSEDPVEWRWVRRYQLGVAGAVRVV